MEEFKQKDFSMVHYITKFDDLSCYAPFLVATLEARNNRTIKGLHYYIANKFVVHKNDSFECILNSATKSKQAHNEFRAFRKALRLESSC